MHLQILENLISLEIDNHFSGPGFTSSILSYKKMVFSKKINGIKFIGTNVSISSKTCLQLLKSDLYIKPCILAGTPVSTHKHKSQTYSGSFTTQS